MIDLSVLVWSSGGEEPERIARISTEVAADVRPFTAAEADAVVEAYRVAPAPFVVVDAKTAPESIVLCKRLRALDEGAPGTIAVAACDARDVAAHLEAGADVVWPCGVADEVVASALRRASARRSHETFVSSVIDAAPDALFVLSPDGRIRSANVGVRAMLGHDLSTLEGRWLCELVEGEGARLVRALVREAIDARDAVAPAVVRLRRHDGTSVEIELAARCMLDDAAIRGILVTARDASERMSVGAALQEAETRFGAIFDNFLDGLAQVDAATGRLVQVNPAFSMITGYDAEDVSGLTLLDLFPPEDRDRMAEILDAHVRGARDVTESMCILHKDRTPVYVDFGTTRMELSGVRFVLCVVRDVTARRETERTRELFLAVVAHELRTPVAVLQNSVELLRSRRLSAAADHDVIVGVLDEEVQRLVRIVADAVDLGAIEAGTFVMKAHRVDLAPLVTSVAERLAPRFDGHARLRLDAVEALVDPERFEQIVTKLLDNAWRHGGGPEIDVSLSAADGGARLDIVDRGPGLPQEIRARVFERVFLPNARPTSGIGLGLWLSKRLVTSMGGSIHASTGPDGRGVQMTVTLPRSEDATRSA